MNILFMMVPMALTMGFIFIYLFIRIVKSGQYDDLKTPAVRILLDEEKK